MRSEIVSVCGATKVYLDALVALRQKPPSAVVAEAITSLVRALPDAERDAVEALVSQAFGSGIPQHRPEPKQTYKYSRLCFKRKVIDTLRADDEFRIETPMGVFQMSRAEFDTDFGKISKTASWQDLGFYSYPVVPSKAEKYRMTALLTSTGAAAEPDRSNKLTADST
jgi:hypothetical protein